jgi:phosphatidylglycerophosphatase A
VKAQAKDKLSKKVFRDPRYFIAFGFGSGLLPYVPGTWGTLAAIPLYLLLAPLSPLLYIIIVLAFFLLGVWLSDLVTRELGIPDYSGIVWDEVVGYLLTMFYAPRGILWVVLGFILFRIFDIVKPYPISLVDKHMKNGLGVMLDDVLAAIPSWLLLQALAWIIYK